MTSPDGAVHLVVNGEFYGYREIRERLRASGYRFSTESDSEIALHLYDERGMQAATSCAVSLRWSLPMNASRR